MQSLTIDTYRVHTIQKVEVAVVLGAKGMPREGHSNLADGSR